MRLYEHEAKQVFAARGIPVPRSFGVITDPGELEGLEPTFPLMVKAMVLTGGRGKRGGVRRVKDPAEAREAAETILGLEIGDYRVEHLLLEEAAAESGACYLGVTMNPKNFNLILLASARGGVEIERTAREEPEAVLRREIPDNDPELPTALAEEVGIFLAKGLGGAAKAGDLADLASRLYATFQELDCKVAEINPLLVTEEGGLIAVDAKVVIDDNALYRHRKLFRLLGLTEARHDVSELTPDERRAREAGFPYVDLLPADHSPDPEKLYVGLVPGGAGYGIFSIDEVANIGDRHFGGRILPVNFMDSGGGPPLERVAEMFHLLMDKEIVDLVITSRFGGISSCDIFIRGLVDCLRVRLEKGMRIVPVHGRMVGTDLPGARAFLVQARIETPEALEPLRITVGNQRIMAEVIREGIDRGFEWKGIHV